RRGEKVLGARAEELVPEIEDGVARQQQVAAVEAEDILRRALVDDVEEIEKVVGAEIHVHQRPVHERCEEHGKNGQQHATVTAGGERCERVGRLPRRINGHGSGGRLQNIAGGGGGGAVPSRTKRSRVRRPLAAASMIAGSLTTKRTGRPSTTFAGK